MKNYFGKDISASADMERHTKAEKDLRDRISQAEAVDDGSTLQKMEIESYRNFLAQLLQSKANVASRLFK